MQGHDVTVKHVHWNLHILGVVNFTGAPSNVLVKVNLQFKL